MATRANTSSDPAAAAAWLETIRASGARGSDVLVALEIARGTRGVRALADGAGINYQTVCRSLQRLEELGFLRADRGRGRRPTDYALVVLGDVARGFGDVARGFSARNGAEGTSFARGFSARKRAAPSFIIKDINTRGGTTPELLLDLDRGSAALPPRANSSPHDPPPWGVAQLADLLEARWEEIHDVPLSPALRGKRCGVIKAEVEQGRDPDVIRRALELLALRKKPVNMLSAFADEIDEQDYQADQRAERDARRRQEVQRQLAAVEELVVFDPGPGEDVADVARFVPKVRQEELLPIEDREPPPPVSVFPELVARGLGVLPPRLQELALGAAEVGGGG